MKALPELAGYLAMVEIYTSIPKFHRTTIAALHRPLFRHKRVKDFDVQDHLLGKEFNQAGQNHALSEVASLARSLASVPDRPTAGLKFLIHEELDLAGPSASIKSPIRIP
jgi:hypothetical protein